METYSPGGDGEAWERAPARSTRQFNPPTYQLKESITGIQRKPICKSQCWCRSHDLYGTWIYQNMHIKILNFILQGFLWKFNLKSQINGFLFQEMVTNLE